MFHAGRQLIRNRQQLPERLRSVEKAGPSGGRMGFFFSMRLLVGLGANRCIFVVWKQVPFCRHR
jgi:hypothetical protein